MSTRKLLPQFIGLVFTIWLLAGCGSTPTEPATIPTPIPSPTAASVTVSAESGFITGRVHLQAPPTPPMVVYAVDNTSGAWFFTETEQTDGEASFTLQVSPGAYQVFAFADTGPFAGYSEDGWELATVTVAANQTVSDIIVRPPGQSECGATFGLPASPDGRFAAIDGPSTDCRTAVTATVTAAAGEQAAIETAPSAPGAPQNETAEAGLPNPASVFCQGQGGQVDIRTENGGEVGYCIFLDGSQCEEWAFFNGNCIPGSASVCGSLAYSLEQRLGVGVTITAQTPFEDYITGQTGTGCRVTATGTGLDFENVGVLSDALNQMFQNEGWHADLSYDGGGPTGMLGGYRYQPALCLWMAEWEPSEAANCPSDQPISACELSPEQKLYTITLDCLQDTTAIATAHPERIQFSPGAISSQVQSSLAANGFAQYVLTAMAGQEMTVRLGDPAEVNAILVIWGEDGTVLISNHASATTWTGELPLTQDYYIDVRSVAQVPINYTIEVIIPSATNASEGPEVLPLDVPVGFEFLFGLADSLMLPPDFPVDAGLPPVQPYVITAEPGEYEISLDYGSDCRGAGACHYGSLAGKKVASNQPESTRNFVFEADRAQKVTLANGIEGYFIEARCGANCDDAKLFWIYNGFQYMIGLKGGAQSDVVDLANAAITNSL